jgi:hypothetical protein
MNATLGKQLVEHLGLPDTTTRLEIVIEAGKPGIFVDCRFMVKDEQGFVEKITQYELIEKPSI